MRTTGVILHCFAYGDTSRILRVLTPDYGMRSLIAKGARSAKSRFGGLLEPFTEGETQFNLRPGRDLLILAGFSLSRSRQRIGADLGAFTAASLIAEIVIRVGTEEAQPVLFTAVTEAFDALTSPQPDAAGTGLAKVWNLISLLGFQPELDLCVRCGSPLGAGEQCRFDVEAGGAACLRCRPAGRRVSPASRGALAVMCASGDLPGEPLDRRLQADLLHAFLGAHLVEDRPLRALPLFLENLRSAGMRHPAHQDGAQGFGEA